MKITKFLGCYSHYMTQKYYLCKVKFYSAKINTRISKQVIELNIIYI